MTGFDRADGALACDGASLEQAAAEHGTPLYVYSRAALEAAYRSYASAFARVPHRICYAVKANGNGALLRLFAGLGAGAVVLAFDAAMPGFGGWVVAFCVFLFGYTTLIGWAYYGEQCLEYILGPRVVTPYRWVYCSLVVFGAISKVNLVWAWGDLMNGLQIFPNLVGVLGLSGVVAKLLSDEEARSRAELPAGGAAA